MSALETRTKSVKQVILMRLTQGQTSGSAGHLNALDTRTKSGSAGHLTWKAKAFVSQPEGGERVP